MQLWFLYGIPHDSHWSLQCEFCTYLIIQNIYNCWVVMFWSVVVSKLHTLNYLLTYSMVQSLPWEANWFAASQEIPRISRNPKFHYRTQKRPSPVSILGQPNQVHIPTSHLLEIHLNIIHPSMPRSSQWFFPPVSPPRPYTPPPLLTQIVYK